MIRRSPIRRQRNVGGGSLLADADRLDSNGEIQAFDDSVEVDQRDPVLHGASNPTLSGWSGSAPQVGDSGADHPRTELRRHTPLSLSTTGTVVIDTGSLRQECWA